MFRLSIATDVESKAKLLRHNIVFLLAGAPDSQRDTWNLLLEMTNNFSQHSKKQQHPSPDKKKKKEEEEEEDDDWQRVASQRATITWECYAGDVLLALLVLAGDMPETWLGCKSGGSSSSRGVLTGIPLLDDGESSALPFAQARLARYLSPSEQRHCRDLFVQFTLGGKFSSSHSSSSSSSSNIFSILLPLMLSFPTTATSAEKESDGILLRRSIVAATVSTLAAAASRGGGGGLLALLLSVLEEKKDQPTSTALEGGFQIAELLATPPTRHGLMLRHNDDDDEFIWSRELSSKQIVDHFSSLLRQVGDVILLQLSPSFQVRSNNVVAVGPAAAQQQSAATISTTNIRVLCASLFFVGRLLLPPSSSAAAGASPRRTESDEDTRHHLRSALASLDLPRLALVERELLGPSFSPLLVHIQTSPSFEAEEEKALCKLESLLFALYSLPGMIAPESVQRAVMSIAALVWDKVVSAAPNDRGSLIRRALSRHQNDDDIKSKHLSRSCVRLVFGISMESLMLARDATDGSTFLTSMLLRPVVMAAAATASQETAAGAGAGAAVDVIDSLVLLAEEAADSLLSAAAATSGAVVASPPSTVSFSPDASSSSQQQKTLLVHLLLGELFKESVHLQQQSASSGSALRVSDAMKSRIIFVSALVCRIDIRRLLMSQVASSSTSSSSLGVLSFYEHLLRLCLWTVSVFAGAADGGLQMATLQLLEALPPMDDIFSTAQEENRQQQQQQQHASALIGPATKTVLCSIRDIAGQISTRTAGGDSSSKRLFTSSVQRNLKMLQQSCDILLISSSSSHTKEELSSSSSSSSSSWRSREFAPSFLEIHQLFDRRLWSALSAVLMDITHKLGSLDLKHMPAEERASLAAVVAPEVTFVATKVLLVATLKQEQRHQQQQQQATSARSRMSAFRKKKEASGSSTDDQQSSPAAASAVIIGEGNSDDLTISASCCFLSLAALMRLDDSLPSPSSSSSPSPATPKRPNDGTRRVVLTALHNADKNRAKSEASAFAAAVLDVVVRIADDDVDGVTIRNIVFDSAAPVSVEGLLLEISRSHDGAASSSSCVEFQALRLCALNVLGACYQRVPIQCQFHVVESLIVGIFRSRYSSLDTDDDDAIEEQKNNQALSRLGAAALLSNVAPAIAAAAAGDVDKGDESAVLSVKKLLQLCEHVSQFRSGARGEQMLFDAEIQAHGRVAAATAKKMLPEGTILAIEKL